MPNFHSIKFRFIALGVGLLLAALVARLSIGIPFVRGQIVELVSSQQMTITDFVARGVGYSLQQRRNRLETLARDLPAARIAQPDTLAAWLRDAQHANPLFSRLTLLSASSRHVLASASAGTSRHDTDAVSGDWFHRAPLLRATTIGTPVRAPDGRGYVAMATPVRDRSGTTVAILGSLTRLDAPDFLDPLQKTRLGEHGGFLLISPRDRLIVAAGESSLALTATPPAGTPFYDKVMAGYRGSGIAVNPDGVEEIATVASVPGSDWFVVARLPTAEALRSVAAFQRLSLKGGVIVLALIAVIFGIFMTHLLSPLINAAHLIGDMATGQRALEPLPVVNRRDEVGDLLRGFNHLVARLHEKEKALNDTLRSLDQQASTDSLTGAWNRRQFDELSAGELARADRYGQPLSIMLLDLDLFKKINDDYGHGEGDRVLQQVADCIRWTLRKSDSLTRWGGEEFIVLMPQTTLQQAVVLAERVRASIASHRIMEQDTVTASIGVAEFVPPETRDQWVARADAAMYRAKRSGRNRIEIDHVPGGVPVLTAPRKADVGQLLWSDHFDSGHPTLDAQHRALFDDSNVLLDTIRNGGSEADIAERANTLIRHVLRHFQDEESLLLTVNHPLINTHVALHKALVHGAKEQLQRFRAGTLGSNTLSRFLAHDLVAKHILNDDHDFFTLLAPPLPSALECDNPNDATPR